MPASKAEQVLEAIRALLETVPDAVVERNSVLPEKVPAGGLIILRDGDPGEPESTCPNRSWRSRARAESRPASTFAAPRIPLRGCMLTVVLTNNLDGTVYA